MFQFLTYFPSRTRLIDNELCPLSPEARAPTAQTIIDGFRIYYNFIRPHMALDGKTPAEKANIQLQLRQNKWLELIKASVKK